MIEEGGKPASGLQYYPSYANSHHRQYGTEAIFLEAIPEVVCRNRVGEDISWIKELIDAISVDRRLVLEGFMAGSKHIDIPRNVIEKITKLFMGLLSEMPLSDEAHNQSPRERARKLALEASLKAAGASGSLAIPPGPVGMLTVLPDLAIVWRIQRQLVADIASCYGKTAELGKEQMLYCLFKHAAGQIVRDVVVRVGERILIKRASLQVTQRVLRRIGVVVTERVVGRTISRWLPIVGAVGVGAYAFYDTAQVAKTSISLFESQVDTEPAR